MSLVEMDYASNAEALSWLVALYARRNHRTCAGIEYRGVMAGWEGRISVVVSMRLRQQRLRIHCLRGISLLSIHTYAEYIYIHWKPLTLVNLEIQAGVKRKIKQRMTN